MLRKFLLFVFIAPLCMLRGYAGETPPETGIVEKLGDYLPREVELYDESGNVITLGSVLTKPTIITFVYYECPGICTPLLTEVAKVVDKMSLEPGKDYQILTISFDHTERPEMAASKKENYIAEVKRNIDPAGWRFFTGDSLNIHRLTDAAGFYYKRDGINWIHPTALIAISPEGKITRYLYGIHQLPLDVKLAVMEASQGKTGPTIAKVLNFCFAYDPVGKHYAFDVVRVSGVVMVGMIGFFIYFFLVRPKKTGKG